MTDRPEGTVILGNYPDWTPPPYTARLMALVDRLRAAGIEPTKVLLPTPPPLNEPLFVRFYDVPVAWAPGAERAEIVVELPDA